MLRCGARAFRATVALRAEAASATSQFLNLTLATPNQIITDNAPIHQIVVSTTEGDMGVLANHAPTIAELKPGVVSVYADATAAPTKYFVPGGFLVIEADSSASVTASEAIPLDDFDASKVKKALEDATAELAKATGEEAQVNARIEVEVYNAINLALTQ